MTKTIALIAHDQMKSALVDWVAKQPEANVRAH